MTTSSSSSWSDAVWIYHERQEASLCGQHALNNLVQAPVFSVAGLAQIAHYLDQLERSVLTDMSGNSGLIEHSSNIDAAGNFSIQVLKEALKQEFHVDLPHINVVLPQVDDITEMQGFLCHKSDHWFAIRKVGGRFWNMNSMLERPEAISHFQLGTHIQDLWNKDGYTIFGVIGGLPVGGEKLDITQGVSQWHLMSDLLRGQSTKEDPWKSLSGAGRRLDGSSSNSGYVDDELQRVLRESLRESTMASNDVVIPEEPPAGAPGVVRLQIKLPNGKRLVRRFNEKDSVKVIYALVKKENGGNESGSLELRYGFPPKDLIGMQGLTVGEAKLSRESIQGRFT